jgi:hypothetical protein
MSLKKGEYSLIFYNLGQLAKQNRHYKATKGLLKVIDSI